MEEFGEHIEMKIHDLAQILSYLNQNENIVLNKKLYNKINSYINSIDTLKDEIYMEKEKKNLEDKTKEINYLNLYMNSNQISKKVSSFKLYISLYILNKLIFLYF